MDTIGALRRLMRQRDEGMATHVAWLARRFGRQDLAPFAPADVRALSQILERVDAAAGTRLLTAGEPAPAAFVIERGEVELVLDQAGRRRLLAVQRPGGVVGDIPLLCELPAPFTALTRSRSTLLRLPARALDELLAAHPAIALRWLTSTVRRLEHANRRIVALTAGGLADRVVALLADELMGQEDAPTTRIDLTQAEIAALLGASRQSVNAVLSRLADQGLVRTGYGAVDVLDPRGLLERCGQDRLLGGRC